MDVMLDRFIRSDDPDCLGIATVALPRLGIMVYGVQIRRKGRRLIVQLGRQQLQTTGYAYSVPSIEFINHKDFSVFSAAVTKAVMQAHPELAEAASRHPSPAAKPTNQTIESHP